MGFLNITALETPSLMRFPTQEQLQISDLMQRVKLLEGLVAGLREETRVLLEDEPIKRGE